MNNKESRDKESNAERTSRLIVKLLKQEGPLDALQLATHIGITRMAIRQHLYNLQSQKLVEFSEEARAMGRPAKVWKLTTEANRLFPDGHAELSVRLIESMREAFGEEGLDKLLEIRNRKMVQQYLKGAQGNLSLKERLEALVEQRTAEGYMAEIAENPDGSFLFIEKHCPICEAAEACSGICRKEQEMLQEVLGEEVEVERTGHILSGQTRCTYWIHPAGSKELSVMEG